MSVLSENVIPGNHGKTFSTNAKDLNDLNRIKDAILTLEGVDKVVINDSVFPAEISVVTHALVQVNDIEKR